MTSIPPNFMKYMEFFSCEILKSEFHKMAKKKTFQRVWSTKKMFIFDCGIYFLHELDAEIFFLKEQTLFPSY